MPCKICGDPNATYQSIKRQVLCSACSRSTPPKMARSLFDRLYWGNEVESVPQSTRREFYEDYLTSNYNFRDYQQTTTKEA